MRDAKFKRHGIRYLSVTGKPAVRSEDIVDLPQIRITGKWLGIIGFKRGRKLLMQYEPNRIVIQLIQPPSDQE